MNMSISCKYNLI